jgi:hypothetical protein
LGAAGRVSSPKQFVLLKLEVHGKDRETIIGAYNFLGGQTGSDAKEMIPFTSEQIRTGVYKVTLSRSLEPGEYCFMSSNFNYGAHSAGAAGAADIFDFGFSPVGRGSKP